MRLLRRETIRSTITCARRAQRSLFVPAVIWLAGCYLPATGYGPWKPDDGFFAKSQEQEAGGNGIEVEEPKIYDDASLRLMLDQARSRLAAINGLNESALVGRLGAITGSRIDQTQFGLQVTGPSLAGTSTVANGATSQTTTNTLPANNVSLPLSSVVQGAPNQNVTTTVPSAAPPASPAVPAGLAFTPPSGMTGSALDVLNEEMQLTSEITGLELLLEGALSDRFVKNLTIIKPRATIGFPISLTPQPRFKNAVAVVEVEVQTAQRNFSSGGLPEPPAITALLPREKTYNVAALTDRSTSIGTGAVIGTVGVAGSFFSGHKTYYVVQDQDTVALQRPTDVTKKDPMDPIRDPTNTTTFAWEFRPVLGQEFVRGGMKQTFVQLAFPVLRPSSLSCFGSIKVRTYWRRFDQKTGLSGEVIKGSVLSRARFSIPHYNLTPFVEGVAYEDLGDGTVLVNVQGSFLSGTYVQLGPTRYDAGIGLRVEDTGLTFVASAEALARWTGQVVSRDGRKAGILHISAQPDLPVLDQFSCADENPPPEPVSQGMAVSDVRVSADKTRVEIDLQKAAPEKTGPAGVALVDVESQRRVDLVSAVATGFGGDSATVTAAIAPGPNCGFGFIAIKDVKVKTLDESTSEICVVFAPAGKPLADFPQDILLDIGHKVFGLNDTLVERGMDPARPSIKAVVPTSLLVSSRTVRAFRPFWTAPDGREAKETTRQSCFSKTADLPGFGLESAVERVVLVSADKKGNASYLLYGSGLSGAKILLAPPKAATLSAIDNLPMDRVLLLTVTKAYLQNKKKLILQKKDGERPLLLDLPLPAAKPAAPAKVGIDSPVIQNTDEMVVPLDKPADLSSVKMGDKQLKFEYKKGDAFIRLKNLRADGVTAEQKTQELTFAFKDGTKVKVKLEVVAARVGVK